MVSDVNAVDAAAAVKEAALARGASDDLHGTMIAVKEAEIGVKLVGTIRNKLLDAFNDIWKTSV
jgi:flagellar hook-basal body complex protein FliE